MAPDPFGVTEKYDGLCDRLDRIAELLDSFPRTDQQHSPQYREWQPFRTSVGLNLSDQGTALLVFTPERIGWEAKVGRVNVTISGAGSSAVLAFYVVTGGTLTSAANATFTDYTARVDGQSSFYGNSPSFADADYNTPVYLSNHEQFVVAVTGAPTSGLIVARFEGVHREV